MHVADNLECSNIALFIVGKALFISIDANSGRGGPLKIKPLGLNMRDPLDFLQPQVQSSTEKPQGLHYPESQLLRIYVYCS